MSKWGCVFFPDRLKSVMMVVPILSGLEKQLAGCHTTNWHEHNNDTPAAVRQHVLMQTDFKWEKEHRYETSDQRSMEWLRHVYPT